MTTSPPTLVLTQAQRRSLADLVPQFADRLELHRTQSRSIEFSPGELRDIRQRVAAAIPQVRNGSKKGSLQRILAAAESQLDRKPVAHSPIPIEKRVYQFRITLCETRPSIWRRIQIQAGTLDQLHEYIQTSMGWSNTHLYQFEIDGQRYLQPEMMSDAPSELSGIDTTIATIESVLPADGRRFSFQYEYDFGDDWQHEVLFEGYLRADPRVRYPICLEGERACPPEDVGGVWGYFECLEALADPTHEQHDDFRIWCGSFDPDVFDAAAATRAMRRGLPRETLDEI